MTNHLHCKLGKRPRRRDARTLKMARYLTTTLPAAPASVDYTRGIAYFGTMLNDQLGCCTIAAVGHAVQVWTVNALGRELTVPDAAILNYYEKWDSYNPSDPTTDQGGVELDVLNNWRQQGFDGEPLDAFVAIGLGNSISAATGAIGRSRDRVIGRSGDRVSSENSGAPGQGIPGANESAARAAGQRPADHPITGSAAQAIPDSGFQIPDHGSETLDAKASFPRYGIEVPDATLRIPEIATAIWLFGGAYIGVELPISAQNQDVWDVADGPDAEPGSWGGHAVYLVGYHLVPGGLSIADGRLSTEKPHASGLPIVDGRLSIETQSANPQPASTSTQSSIDHRQSTITCITWGQPKRMTWAFFEKYCSEAYALVSRAWIETSGLAPSGFDLAALEKDLEAFTCPSSLVTGHLSLVVGQGS
jgi:hypothetical protein